VKTKDNKFKDTKSARSESKKKLQYKGTVYIQNKIVAL